MKSLSSEQIKAKFRNNRIISEYNTRTNLNKKKAHPKHKECKGCVAQRKERLSHSGKDAGSNFARESRRTHTNLYINKEKRKNQAHSLEKAPLSLREISHELKQSQDTCVSHALDSNRRNEYKYFSFYNNYTTVNPNRIFIIITLLILLSINTHAAFIDGFDQLRYRGNFSLNTSTLSLITDNTSRIYVAESGLVGIGTVTPVSIFDVSQNVTTSTNIDHNDTAYLPGLAWNSTLLNVTSTSGFPESGTLVIGAEAITYTGISGNTFTGLERNMLGTAKANHTNNTAVYYLTSSITRNTTLTPYFIVKSDGRIGVGTINATAYLDVVGATSSAASISIQSGSAPTSPDVGDIYSDGTDLFFYDGGTWRDLTTETTSGGGWTDDGTIVRLTSINDYVGIGTATPSEKLTVSGNGSYTGDLVVGGNLIGSGLGVGSQSIGWIDDGAVVRLVTSTDSVGIGIAAAATTLHVNGSGSAAGFRVTNESGDFSFFVNASLGRVGINTLTPTQALDVNGHINVTGTSSNSSFTGDVKILGTLYGGSPLKVGGGINVSSTSGKDAFFVSNGSGVKIFRISDKGELNITSAAGNTSYDQGTLFVDAENNKVGIGTTTPNEKLEVGGNISVLGGEAFLTHRVGNDYGWAIYSESGNALTFAEGATGDEKETTRVTFRDNGKVGIGTTSPKEKLVVVGGVNITNGANISNGLNVLTGNVGIGTTTPATGKLHVETPAGDAENTILYLRNYAHGTNTEIAMYAENDAGTLRGGSNMIELDPDANTLSFSNDKLTIDSAGNVGIGTTVPDAKLHVEGNISVGRNINTAAFSRYIGLTANAGGFVAGQAVMEIENEADGDNNLHFHTQDWGVGGGRRMTIDYTGNVGIGTTSPAEPLTVLAGVNTGMLLRSETDNNNLIHLGPYGSSAANKERGFMTLSDTGTVTVSLSSYGASYFNAGNVGIGTTSPSTLLTLESNDFVMMNLSRTSTPSNMEIHFSDSGGLTGAIGGGAGADDTGGVYLSGDGSTRDLVINNAGNVGIGTTVPRADLDIYDTAGGHNVLAYFSKGTGTFDHFRINTLAVGADADRVGFELMDGAGGNHNSHYWIDDTGDMYQKIDSPPGSDQDGTVIGSVAFTGTHLYKLKQGLNASEHIGKAVILNNNELELASTPQDKRVVGIIYKNLAGTRSYDSIGNEIPIQKSENGTWLNTEIQDQYAYVASIGDTIQDVLQGMAVTNINGPVEAGDLLVSSSIPGYLMKQDDDIIRSYTVAKAMKDVIFDENGKAEGVYGFLYGG